MEERSRGRGKGLTRTRERKETRRRTRRWRRRRRRGESTRKQSKATVANRHQHAQRWPHEEQKRPSTKAIGVRGQNSRCARASRGSTSMSWRVRWRGGFVTKEAKPLPANVDFFSSRVLSIRAIETVKCSTQFSLKSVLKAVQIVQNWTTSALSITHRVQSQGTTAWGLRPGQYCSRHHSASTYTALFYVQAVCQQSVKVYVEVSMILSEVSNRAPVL